MGAWLKTTSSASDQPLANNRNQFIERMTTSIPCRTFPDTSCRSRATSASVILQGA